MSKRYWSCLIGGVEKSKLREGADWDLRHAVRNKFSELYGEDEVCASGWGVDEERYEILRSLGIKTTEELKEGLDFINNKNK